MNLYEFIFNSPTCLIDFLGQRPLTDEEWGIYSELLKLATTAGRAGDRDFFKAVWAVAEDYRKLIEDIKGKNDPVRVQVLNGAFKIWADPDDAKSYLQKSGYGSWAGAPKCNKYVGEVLWDAGVDIKIGRHWPVVLQLSDPKQVGRLRVVWQVKTKKEKSGDGLTVVLTQPLKGKPGMRPPRVGDIIIFGTAHVGIDLGHGIYISATSAQSYGQEGVVIKGTADGYNLLYRSPDED